MENGNNRAEVYSTKIRAGKRTYFFDVKETRSSDYYITITESKRRFGGDGYDKHKIFLYKEDFNKFLNCLTDTINHVKTELLPDYDYEEFDRDPIQSDYNNTSNSNANNDEGNKVAAEEPSYNKEEEDDTARPWDD